MSKLTTFHLSLTTWLACSRSSAAVDMSLLGHHTFPLVYPILTLSVAVIEILTRHYWATILIFPSL